MIDTEGSCFRARLLPFGQTLPRIAREAFVAPGAVVIGDVEVDAHASIWFGCILRGDVERIRIGARSNIQDATVIHVSRNGLPTRVGTDVTVGHACVLHACTLEDRAFVGMRATLLDGSRIESDGMLAAGALLTPGKVVPSGQLFAGQPARFMRELQPEEIRASAERAAHYVELAQAYQESLWKGESFGKAESLEKGG